MTAIYAYVEDDTAFIGVDTRRAIGLLSSVVTKVHRWSEHILLAQTGAGKAVTELIYAMMVTRDNNPAFVSFADLSKIFDLHQKKMYQAAQANSKVTIVGTLVAACASDATAPAQIATFDFAAGGGPKIVGGSGSAYADGTDAAAFQSAADHHIQCMRANSDAFALDRWAMTCIADAHASYPSSVDWPADLVITRPCPSPIRLTTFRRVASVTAQDHPTFRI
jgi:hypothetical protein